MMSSVADGKGVFLFLAFWIEGDSEMRDERGEERNVRLWERD